MREERDEMEEVEVREEKEVRERKGLREEREVREERGGGGRQLVYVIVWQILLTTLIGS